MTSRCGTDASALSADAWVLSAAIRVLSADGCWARAREADKSKAAAAMAGHN